MPMEERELQRRVQAFVRRFGLLNQDQTPCGHPISPSQAHALQVLGESGPLAQQQLAERLGLEKSTVSRLAGSMAGRGWLERTVNPDDRREFRLSLTERGRRVLGDVQRLAERRYAGIIARIPPSRRAQVLESLSLLTDAVPTGED
jgi:DNA-binding MarR family transcriptional regulator